MKGFLSDKNHGFTLIELMLLVSLIGVALSVGLPSFKSFFERQRIDSVADNLYFLMKLGRSEAAKQGSDTFVVVRKTTATSWCVGLSDNDNDCNCSVVNSCSVDTAERVIKSTEYTDVSMESFANGSKTLIEIDGTRGRSNLGQTVKFITNSGTDKKDIQLVRNKMGRDRICSPTGTSNRYPKC